MEQGQRRWLLMATMVAERHLRVAEPALPLAMASGELVAIVPAAPMVYMVEAAAVEEI